jgi:hypothetical protein
MPKFDDLRATNNLFNIVKAHLNNRMSHTNETIEQLDRIQQFILDLEAIRTEMLKNETSPTQQKI